MVADDLRQINVQLEAGSTFPASLDLRITPGSIEPIFANGGTTDSAGTVTAAGNFLGSNQRNWYRCAVSNQY
jgi:hypothetical protein